MKIYLDACCLQRPLDDRTQPRINLEAEAVLTLLRLVEAGNLTLFSSEALLFELGRIPDSVRRARAEEMLRLASEFIQLNDDIEAMAQKYIDTGISPMDALHLASAFHAQTDYFSTCDDRLLKKAQKLPEIAARTLSPLQLAAEVAP